MTATRVEEVAVGSPRHDEQLALRGAVLRIPLGLDPATARNAREEEARHFVALDAEARVIGCVSLLPLGAGAGKLFQMAVAPEHQRRGVGRVLVRHLESVAREAGLRRVTMHARDVAAPFYEALGYAREGELFYEVSIPHYVMSREL